MKIKGLRWCIVGLIGLATLINYVDRSALTIMWPGISKEFGLTKVDYALLLNFFMIFYALGQFFSGKLFDKIGTRWGYVVSIFFWSLSSLLHSFSKGFRSIALFRIMLGYSEAGNWPGAVKSNAEWFPVKDRAIAQGIFNAGASLGSIIAPPMIAMLYLNFGWRNTFLIIGILGILWIIPWLIINKKSPKKHPWITEEEKDYILSTDNDNSYIENDKHITVPLKKILSYKASWGLILGRFFIEPIWWFFVGWMPNYLKEIYHFDVKEIGMFAWVPYVGAALGSIVGGWLTSICMKKGWTVSRSRKFIISVGGLIMLLGLIGTILIANTPNRFIFFSAIVLFGFQFSISNIQTIPSDLFNGKSVGTLAGFGGTVGVFSVIMMNFIIPYITKSSYIPAFALILVFVPLGIFFISRLCKNLEPIKI